MGCVGVVAVVATTLAIAIVVLLVQARRTPAGEARYVALGSSYAAGAGLGKLQAGSPWLCARSVGGYPQQLAERLQMPTADMSCGGAVTRHVLNGGQFFQGPQVRVIGPETRLVTLTVGGNDIGYVGDLSMLAARKDKNLLGALVRMTWDGPRGRADRNLDLLRNELVATIREIRHRAPKATVIVATYPTILPTTGACDLLGLTQAEAATMREVADDLAAATRAAAAEGGAQVVDMHTLGRDHNACSAQPWVTGWKDAGPAPFHPNAAGAHATASAIADLLARQR